MSSRDNYVFQNNDALPPELTTTMAHLLKSWDDPNDNYDFVNDFLPNAVLRFGIDATGHDQIKNMKAGMIHPTDGPVIDLQHTFEKGFVLPGASDKRQEFIGTAEVWYELKNGKKITCRPASHAMFVHDAEGGKGEWKVEWYEVHMDATELNKAIVDMLAEEKGK